MSSENNLMSFQIILLNLKNALINYIVKSLPRYFLEFLIVSVMILIILVFTLQGQEIIKLFLFYL